MTVAPQSTVSTGELSRRGQLCPGEVVDRVRFPPSKHNNSRSGGHHELQSTKHVNILKRVFSLVCNLVSNVDVAALLRGGQDDTRYVLLLCVRGINVSRSVRSECSIRRCLGDLGFVVFPVPCADVSVAVEDANCRRTRLLAETNDCAADLKRLDCQRCLQ